MAKWLSVNEFERQISALFCLEAFDSQSLA